MKKIYLKIACFLTGYYYEILKNYDGYSQRKIGVLAIAMVFPTAVYFIDGLLASKNLAHASLFQSLIIALLAALFIFLLEKAIIMAKVSTLTSIFRFFFALVFSFIGALFLMMDLFPEDVNAQVARMLASQRNEFVQQALIDHQTDVQIIERDQKKHQAEFDQYAQLAISETKGEVSGKKGAGPLVKYYAAQRDLIKSKYLIPLEAKRDSLQKVMDTEVVVAMKTQADHVGLWKQIKAFFAFAWKDGLSIFLYFLFISGLLSMELMCLALKLGMPESPFEKDELAANEWHDTFPKGNGPINYRYTFVK